MLMRSRGTALALTLVFLTASSAPSAAQTVTSPKQQFGFDIGTDYQLPDYRQLVAYWQKLDRESDRMTVVEIGKTAEGRPQLMAIVTSPENQKRLDRYREISRRLAAAEGLTDEQARALAREGRTVVWIDGGLHATEVLGAQQLMETVFQLVSRSDPETLRILNDCIVLAVHANPDGHDLVADWYMRQSDPQKRSTAGIPRLYQKYIGHDNNRDFYISNQPETTNMNHVLYSEWFPQIVYNHHQTGPAGAVMFAPPFRDPFNYFFDPMVPTELDMVGAAMHTRFASEGKPGVVTRQASGYSTWWNGGLRTMVYFHNMIGLLTETIGNPTPVQIPFVPDRLLANLSQFFPIAPQTWHFRQSIDYSVTANYAVLDLASRNRENFLFNIYRMGKNSIERGSRDTWTVTPTDIAKVKEAAASDRREAEPARRSTQGRGPAAVPEKYFERLRDPALRDPRGYIIPSDQADFATATKFVNALIKAGITIHRASAPFTVAARQYPAGSYVVKTAQAFRPHILDMFEPQDHPNDFQYPGGPPIPPYDNAGWTLAYQMGVQFDRILDGFDAPLQKVNALLDMPAAPFTVAGSGTYRIDHRVNNASVAVNRLLAAGQDVLWSTGSADGAFFVAASPASTQVLQKAAHDLGVISVAADRPTTGLQPLRLPRIGLWDQYGGSMPSGWTRWLLEQYEFPFEVVYPQALDAGDLKAKYDVLIFVDGAIPESDGPQQGRGAFGAQPDPESVPEEFRARLGRVTVAKTVPQIQSFLEQGGTVLTIGSSTSLAYHLKLPISNALVESSTTGGFRPLPQEKFYIPGSILRARVDTAHPLAQGMAPVADVFFDNSPAFRLDPDASLRGIRAVAWFDSVAPLRSGWAWGQHYLDQTVAVAEATVGKGRLLLFGPEILFRGQPHSTFKLLFNGLYLGGTGSLRATTTEARGKHQ